MADILNSEFKTVANGAGIGVDEYVPAYWLLALLFIYRYTLQGLGDSLIPTIAGIMELAMRMSAALILSQYLGFVGPAIASPLAWLGACIPLLTAYHHHKNHLQERFNQKLAQN